MERGTLEVARALVEAGHRSLVMSAGGRLVSQLEREGSAHHTLDIGRKSLWSLRLVPRLQRFLVDERVDVIDARSRVPAWLAWLAWRGLPPASRPRLVTTVHGLYSANPYSAVMVKGERIVAVSQTVREYILSRYPETDPARVTVVERGVDRRAFPHGYRPPPEWLAAWRAEYPALVGKRVLLLPGRLTRLKGQETFIDLVAALRARGLPVHGLIVGGAHPRKRAYLESLQARVGALGLARDVTFTGQRDDLREIMAVSDLVLSLSRQPESFGRTVLEALSLGVRVLGPPEGGVGEILTALYPGGILASGRTEDLAEAVVRTLEAPPPAPVERYTLEAMLAGTLAVYESLAAAPR